MPRLGNLLRLMTVAAGGLASVATSSVEPGDRAGSGQDDCLLFCDPPDPTCPADETCSGLTPNGLYFEGAPFGDGNLFGDRWTEAVAVGGTQTVTVYTDSQGTRPYEGSFDIDLTSESFALIDAAPPSLTIGGAATGTSKLRLLEPGTDLLLDRVEVTAAPIEAAYLQPAGMHVWFHPTDFEGLNSVAVLSNSDADLVVALYGAGHRLVDEGLEATGPGLVPGANWDTYTFSSGDPGIETFSLAAGADFTTDLEVELVERADRIVAYRVFGGDGADPIGPLTVGYHQEYCFRAEHEGRVLLGGELEIWTSEQLSWERPYEQADNCIRFTGAAEGAALVVVSAGRIDRAYEVDVLPQTDDRRAAAYNGPTPTPAPAPGDRAAR